MRRLSLKLPIRCSMRRLVAAVAAGVLALTIGAYRAEATETTIWFSPFELVPEDGSVTIAAGAKINSAVVYVSDVGTPKFAYLPLILASNRTLKSVTVCYKSKATTILQEITVIENLDPTASAVRLQEFTSLSGPTPTCYTTTAATTPASHSPSGGMTLLLKIVAAGPSDGMEFGGIGVTVE